MPAGDALNHHIFLNRNYFYALSWMIDRLGKLKDSGLEQLLIKEALENVFKVSAHADELAFAFCSENQMTINEILQASKKIADDFFGEKILSKLIKSV